MPKAPCDVCGAVKDVQRWYLRPEGEPVRMRLLCAKDSSGLRLAYTLVKPPTGAATIVANIRPE